MALIVKLNKDTIMVKKKPKKKKTKLVSLMNICGKILNKSVYFGAGEMPQSMRCLLRKQ